MKQQLEAMLARSRSVKVACDTRYVTIPQHLKRLPWCVLEFGLNLAKPIVDLAVTESAISGTLSFGGSPFFCRVPFSAILGVEEVDGAAERLPDHSRPIARPRRQLPAGWQVIEGGRDEEEDEDERAPG